jgi:predicted nuclease of predicted toxin-antitoxin system
MRILANENVTRTVIDGLRTKAHDVLSVKESLRGEKDDAILARAQAEKRIVLTHDKDFGALAFRVGLPAECGVILLRLSGADRDADNKRALEAIECRADWEGHFSVISVDRVRMRPLPGNADGKSAPAEKG